MAQDWSPMVTAVEEARGALASSQEAFRQLQLKVEELQRGQGGMNDAEDQKRIDEFAAEFKKIAAELPKAIVTNPAPGTESSAGAQ